MKLLLVRTLLGDDSTLGKLYIDGVFVCYTLEDEVREGAKVPGETAIPEGRYVVVLRYEGGFHIRYTSRFPEMHDGMLHLLDVPGFKYILIHTGNTDVDTAGCILVGEKYRQLIDGNFHLEGSEKAYRRVYPRIAHALRDGHPVTITVRIHGPEDD